MKVKKKILSIVTLTVVFGSLALPVTAAAPVQPNCGGQDASDFARNGSVFFGPGSAFGQFHAFYSATYGPGFASGVLSHLQGIPENSSCPDNGFPTPLH